MFYSKKRFIGLIGACLLTLTLAGCGALETLDIILFNILELDKAVGTTEFVDGSSTQIHFIDSGQSDSVLIHNNGRFALIDAGDTDDDELIVNYLKEQGVEVLDYLIITHFHADHFGAADSVVREFDVQTTLVSNGDANTKVYREFIQALSDKGLKPSVPLEGATFELGDAKLTLYNTDNPSTNPNNKSLVTLLSDGLNKALFTGDAEKEVEDTLLSIKEIRDVDLYKVGHHGSSTSNSELFMEHINPEKAVIMVGEGNKYGHPHREVLDYLNKNQIDYNRTDKDGTVIYELSSDGVMRIE